MRLLNENPPLNIRERCEKKFDLRSTVPIFTYGETIYNPGNAIIDDFITAHELVHTTQQGNRPEKWWGMYINNDKFRYEQELLAYRVQYRVMNDLVKDRKLLAKMLRAIAGDLSSPMYGGLCSLTEAMLAIKKGI